MDIDQMELDDVPVLAFLSETSCVGEVYSPPRVVPYCQRKGLSGGWSLDKLVTDSRGKPWDFDDPARRRDAEKLIRKTRPKLLIGSPMCTYFSNIMNLAKLRMAPGEFERRLEHAVDHLRFMFSLFELQISLGGYIFFEHPKNATSWALDFVQLMKSRPGMQLIEAHMCRFGMTGRDPMGQGLVKKPTGFLTNC